MDVLYNKFFKVLIGRTMRKTDICGQAGIGKGRECFIGCSGQNLPGA